MSDDEDYNSEEDLDYVPTEGEVVSEEENSGDEEDLTVLQDGEGGALAGRRKQLAKKKPLLEPRKRKGGIKLPGEEASGSGEIEAEDEEEKARKKELAAQIAKEEEERKKEKEKKRADDLWASFMSDVKPAARKPATSESSLGSLSQQVTSPKTESVLPVEKAAVEKNSKVEKVTITKVFDFAGEEVKITKEVDADSKEAKQEQKKQEKAKEELGQQQSLGASSLTSGAPSLGLGLKRPAGGGLGSVLSKIGKKNKMGTLEKSKMDWNSFKKKEGIEEDLKIHNKGKQGYTERMAFLNRTDQREYEIERDIRLASSSKR